MTERMTCVFDFDVRDYKASPHQADTPFGKPVIVSRGDLAEESDRFREAIEYAQSEGFEWPTDPFELLTKERYSHG